MMAGASAASSSSSSSRDFLFSDRLVTLLGRVSQPLNEALASVIPDVPAVYPAEGHSLRSLLRDPHLGGEVKLTLLDRDILETAFALEPGPIPNFNLALLGEEEALPVVRQTPSTLRTPSSSVEGDSYSSAASTPAALVAKDPAIKILFRTSTPDLRVADDGRMYDEDGHKHKKHKKHHHGDEDATGADHHHKKKKKHKHEHHAHQTIAH